MMSCEHQWSICIHFFSCYLCTRNGQLTTQTNSDQLRPTQTQDFKQIQSLQQSHRNTSTTSVYVTTTVPTKNGPCPNRPTAAAAGKPTSMARTTTPTPMPSLWPTSSCRTNLWRDGDGTFQQFFLLLNGCWEKQQQVSGKFWWSHNLEGEIWVELADVWKYWISGIWWSLANRKSRL